MRGWYWCLGHSSYATFEGNDLKAVFSKLAKTGLKGLIIIHIAKCFIFVSTKQYVLILHYCITYCIVIGARGCQHQTITGWGKTGFSNQLGMKHKFFDTCKWSLWKLLYIWFWERSLLARKGWQICVHVHYFRVIIGFRNNDLEKNIPVFLWLSNVFYILLQALSRPMGGQSRA